MITGSCGKTTTSRMLADILVCAGHAVGIACTDGVYAAGRKVRDGDSAGYDGAKRVFADKSIDAAVLETARGGLISSGLYTRRCHVAALLNVQSEQVGIDGIETLEAMAKHKAQVTDAATDRVILNLDDEHCRDMAARYAASKITFFSIDPHNNNIEERLAQGSRICTLDEAKEWIVLKPPDQAQWKMVRVDDIPATMSGIVQHNLLNAMAAAALADGMEVTAEAIARGLTAFENSLEMNPGRFNIIHDCPFTVVLDRALSPPSLMRSIEGFMKLPCDGRRLCMISAVGNRPDCTFDEMASLVAGRFVRYICFETDYYRRDRQPGEIARRLSQSLAARGVDEAHIACVETPGDALKLLKSQAAGSDLVYANMMSPDELDQAAGPTYGNASLSLRQC
ncbi:MAG: Mur ligase family protein [Pseudomonadota bacterium]